VSLLCVTVVCHCCVSLLCVTVVCHCCVSWCVSLCCLHWSALFDS